MLNLPWLDPLQLAFPAPETALREPDGLLAAGGDLRPDRLLLAYANGIFPWFSDGQPILWWSPDPRMVVAPQALHPNRSLRKFLRRCDWRVEINRDFAAVIRHCARTPRRGQRGTWITAAMQAAYRELHRLGYAHSVEVYADDTLIGGIYGVGIGRMFFGESMFSLASNASKLAIHALAEALRQTGVVLLDGQVESEHLARLGFAPIPRSTFLALCREQAQPIRPWPVQTVQLDRLQPQALAAHADATATTLAPGI